MKKDISQQATELMRDTIRRGGIVQTADAAALVSKSVNCVEIDRSYIVKKIEAELNRKPRSPINAIFGAMGLRVVRVKKFAERLGNDEVSYSVGVNGDTLCSFLKLNEDEFLKTADGIVSKLAEAENRFAQDKKSISEQTSQVFKKLDEKTKQLETLTADTKIAKESLYQHMQYILSQIGRDGGNSIISQQIVETLEDFGAQVYWESENAPFSETAMFSVLKCENPSERKQLPCIADENVVLLKGMKFILNNL